MPGDRNQPRRRVDADGVVRTTRPRSRAAVAAWIAAALVAAVAVGWLVRAAGPVDQERPGAPPATAGEGVGSAPGARPAAPRPLRLRASTEPAGAPRGDLYVNQLKPGPAGKTGIFAFPPPGTKPIKGGILVPDGYQLPPGYMRHYQTTDDGEAVQPILVFHPDYQPLDADGNPIPIPPDRVVPPELAPPDMPIQVLEAPPVRRDFEETSKPR